jgi:hypothetical protein
MVTTPLPSPTTSNGTQLTTVVTTVAKIASGRTKPGATNWEVTGNGVRVNIDTSAAGFTKTPIYITSIGGDAYHWGTTGASSVYNATEKGFSVSIRWDQDFKNTAITPAEANSYKWHINWIAIEPWLEEGQLTNTQTPSTGTTTNSLPNVGCQTESQLRSINADVATQINFVNNTNSVVKIFWINYQGQRQFIQDLQPGQSVNKSTYVTHPWVVTDAQGTCLGVFQPERDRKDAIIEGSTTQSPKVPIVGQYYYLIAKHSNKALAVTGANTADGGNVLQWQNQKVDHFKWRLEDAGDGYYYLVAKHSGKALAVTGASKDDGANVLQWHNQGLDHFKWRLEDAGDGYFYLVAKHSGKVLNVYGYGTTDGTNVIQYTKSNSDNSKWKFEPV